MSCRPRRNTLAQSTSFTDNMCRSSQLAPSLRELNSSNANRDPYTPSSTALNDSMSGSDSSSSGNLSPGFFGQNGSGSDLSRSSSRKRTRSKIAVPSLGRSPSAGLLGPTPMQASIPGSRGFGPGQTQIGANHSSAYPQRTRPREDASQATSVPNANAHLLQQAEQTGVYGPTSLPPRSYTGQSPFESPRQMTPKILQSQLDYLDDVTRRVDAVELEAQNAIKQRGARAIQNATLPGLEPVQISFGAPQPTLEPSSSSSQNRNAFQQEGSRKRPSSGSFSFK